MPYPESVRIVEVGPRDGLQNESRSVTTAHKVEFIQNLTAAGLRTIECGSFVSPRLVPAMAGTKDVFRSIRRRAGTSYTALVPNLPGLEAALEADVKEVAVFTAASESFSQRNIHCSIDESLTRYREVCRQAATHRIAVRGYVSCVAGCPFEGPVAPAAVLQVATELLGMGCYEVSLGDTIGLGTPVSIERLLDELRDLGAKRLAVHFHDTWGRALANITVAMQAGINVIDSSAGGLGGCPYAPGATGNVATEDVVDMLTQMRIETGIDLDRVTEAGRTICSVLKRLPVSRVSQALAAQKRLAEG